jgi:hypothetical protein
MAVTPQRARELALSLENATEAPHFDRVAFRTPRRIFATLARSGADLNFMFDHAMQKHFCARAPEALAPVPGGWGAWAPRAVICGQSTWLPSARRWRLRTRAQIRLSPERANARASAEVGCTASNAQSHAP